jgi:serine/threonine protein kinase
VLAGYSHVRLLGRGGFADVFLFEQDMPRRQVAVKVLHHNVIDHDVLRMFNAEADVMARLSAHPSILTVHDASISADGRPYLVMELCPGSMGSRFRVERISVAEVLTTGVKIASALETVVRAGMLHRDVKPSNILITTFGTAVLSDFGIASSLVAAHNSDLVAMSVPWSAPEIVEERTSGTVASEVWALGATLYTLLAGRTPFEAEGPGRNAKDQLIARISRATYTPIGRPDVPARLEQLLRRTMERDPSRRQQSLLEVATELQHVQYELGVMPTALEVADDDWTAIAGGAAPRLDDAEHRGPVLSTVPVVSKRKRASTPIARALTDDEFYAQPIPKRRSRFGLTAILAIAGIVVLLGGGAIVAGILVGAR